MKLAIVAFSNLRVTPFYKYYLEIAKQKGIDVDIIVWNRKNEDEDIEDANVIRCDMMLNDDVHKGIKFFYMMKYSRFVKKRLKKEKYDYVVVLTTLLGVFLGDYLIKNYEQRYIIDVRDYSYEHVKFYYDKLEKILSHALLNVISSPSYTVFLPKKEFNVCHNLNFQDTGKFSFEVKNKAPLTIGFVGVIRYAEEFKKVLQSIKNDERVFFEFYGDGEDEDGLKCFCQENEIENVEFNGRFFQDEKDEIYSKIDVIYNCYGNKTNNVKYALSNKLYDALYYKKPILVNDSTSMAKFAGLVGFTVRDYDKLVDDLIEWYNSIDANYFNEFCEKELSFYINENIETASRIRNVLQ